MKTFSVVRNTLLMKVIGVYIKFILFVKEEMTIFSVRTVGDSTANSEEPTFHKNIDFMKIEVSSLDAEALRFNPSTGLVMLGMVDTDGNVYGSSANSSGFDHHDCHGLNLHL